MDKDKKEILGWLLFGLAVIAIIIIIKIIF